MPWNATEAKQWDERSVEDWIEPPKVKVRFEISTIRRSLSKKRATWDCWRQSRVVLTAGGHLTTWEQLGNNWCRIRAKTEHQENAKAQQANKITTFS
jgi:hypothetical protein